MTMITPSYLGETIEYSSLHACRSTLEDPTFGSSLLDDKHALEHGISIGRGGAWLTLSDEQYENLKAK